MMDFLIRFSQVHEPFRKPEIEALAHLFNIEFEWLYYSVYVRLILPPSDLLVHPLLSLFL